jgi:hypothetical protein
MSECRLDLGLSSLPVSSDVTAWWWWHCRILASLGENLTEEERRDLDQWFADKQGGRVTLDEFAVYLAHYCNRRSATPVESSSLNRLSGNTADHTATHSTSPRPGADISQECFREGCFCHKVTQALADCGFRRSLMRRRLQ